MEKLLNYWLVDELSKCSLFSDFKYGLRSCLTADLSTVLANYSVIALRMSVFTRIIARDT